MYRVLSDGVSSATLVFLPGGVQLNSFCVVHRNLDDAFVVKLRQYLMWTQQDRRIEVRAIRVHSSRFIRAVANLEASLTGLEAMALSVGGRGLRT